MYLFDRAKNRASQTLPRQQQSQPGLGLRSYLAKKVSGREGKRSSEGRVQPGTKQGGQKKFSTEMLLAEILFWPTIVAICSMRNQPLSSLGRVFYRPEMILAVPNKGSALPQSAKADLVRWGSTSGNSARAKVDPGALRSIQRLKLEIPPGLHHAKLRILAVPAGNPLSRSLPSHLKFCFLHNQHHQRTTRYQNLMDGRVLDYGRLECYRL